LIEANTMRMHGHAAHDDMRYVPAELLAEWALKDPIERQRMRVAELDGAPDMAELEAGVARELDEAVEWALQQPMPDPASAGEGVFCEGEPEPLEDGMAPCSLYAIDAARQVTFEEAVDG
jgi:pyruvate dehydrogenase E1 component alpha subunit